MERCWLLFEEEVFEDSITSISATKIREELRKKVTIILLKKYLFYKIFKFLVRGSISTYTTIQINIMIVKYSRFNKYIDLARMVELEHTRDLKSLDRNIVPVQVRPRAPVC